jgi:hypothetical protein
MNARFSQADVDAAIAKGSKLLKKLQSDQTKVMLLLEEIKRLDKLHQYEEGQTLYGEIVKPKNEEEALMKKADESIWALTLFYASELIRQIGILDNMCDGTVGIKYNVPDDPSDIALKSV